MAGRATNSDILHTNALGFRVSRKFTIGLDKGPGGKGFSGFSDDAIQEIKTRHKSYTSCYGCYVFSVKVGRGVAPIYVGSATRQTLGKEAFNDRNLRKCERYIRQYKRPVAYITFIAPNDKVDSGAKTRRGNCPKKTIQKLEKVLTAVAFRRNRTLINTQNRGLQDFFIHGALNCNPGRPRAEVADFKDMLGLQDKSIVVVNIFVKKSAQQSRKAVQKQ